MAQVTWTNQALDDLDAICLFIARDTPRYSQIFAMQVFQVVDGLSQFPRLGRVVPEFGRSELREVFVNRYRVIYRLADDQVEILTIHHGLRPLDGINT